MDNKKFRIRSSIALTYNNGVMDFFKTNIRESVAIEIGYNLIEFLRQFDGKTTLSEILDKSEFSANDIENFVIFLHNKNILIETDEEYNNNVITQNYRLINFLEEYCFSTSQVIKTLYRLGKEAVLVVGLGGVGSWVVDILARSGVKKFILVDNDKVELSNLHRQDFFTQKDIGKFKIDCIEQKLVNIDKSIVCKKYYKLLDDDFFNDFDEKFCCAINCADFPNVDKTTQIIGDKCMVDNIPHIVGGGYNLHLTLIGETILPYQSACYKCFDYALQEINKTASNLVKLRRENRKIGSFTPLCTINASLIALEAFKMLCGFYDKLTNLNQRIEFKMRTMNIERKRISRNPNCQICGLK